MRFFHVLTAAALVLLAVPAAAASLGSNDAEYLTTAIQIQAGRYAMASYEQQHGTGAVKRFAASVVSQSASDSRMLEKLAKQYGVTPDKPLLIQDKYHYSQMAGLSGSALDQSFVRELRISDQINQDTYSNEMRHGQNGSLKAHAKGRYAAVQRELTALKHI
ncbi:MAG TPA: DUF4142 domain-containing protein [Candidatus Baltobacteraceae bacterium]|nr:DUF4142 domain-containing protein [Candidatus Baltobacteraceae bacterium]